MARSGGEQERSSPERPDGDRKMVIPLTDGKEDRPTCEKSDGDPKVVEQIQKTEGMKIGKLGTPSPNFHMLELAFT